MASKFASTPDEMNVQLSLQTEMQAAMKRLADARASTEPNPKLKADAITRAEGDIDSINSELKRLSRSTPARSSSSSSTSKTSSSSVTTSGPTVTDQVMAAISPESAIKAQQDFLTSAARTYAGARADAGQIDELNALTLLDAGNLAKLAAQQNLSKNQEQFSIVQKANLDPSKGDNAYFTAMDALQINESEYAAARAQFDQAQSVDFFSDPLGYFQAQLSLPQMAAKVNQLAAKGDAIESDFARRARLSNAARESMFSDQSTQTYELQVAAANAKVREGQAQMLQAKVDRGIKLTDQDLQMAASLGQFQSSTLANLQREITTNAKAAEEDRDAQLRAGIDRINKAAGTDYSLEGLKALGAAAAAPVLEAAQTGALPLDVYVRVATPAGEMNKLGENQATYGAAKAMLNKIKVLQSRDPRLQVKDGMAMATEQFMQRSNAAVSGEDKGGMLTSEQDNSGNPHRIDHSLVLNGVKLAQQTGAKPPVPPTNILMQLLNKELKANQRGEDGNIPAHVEKKVLEYLVDAVAEGKYVDETTGKKIMPADLAKIFSEYYNGAAEYQQNIRKLDIVGVPRATSYAVKLDGMDRPLDIRNPAQAEYLISRVQAAQNGLWRRTWNITTDILTPGFIQTDDERIRESDTQKVKPQGRF